MDQQLARRALRGAIEIRSKAAVALTAPICIYDLVGKALKVEIRFQGGASFGGMYARETQTILVPSERPAGRRAFTCAHELGHWYFNHGTRLEDLKEQDKGGSDDPDEILANQFAANLLMPKWAIDKLFKDESINLNSPTDLQLYAAACQLGVGYETLIQHLRYGLGLISPATTDRLIQGSPKNIRQAYLSEPFANHLIIVSKAWSQVPIDLEVGDGVYLNFSATTDSTILVPQEHRTGSLFVAKKPGITKVQSESDAWASFVRISRKGYTGRSTFRHLEDPDE
jgi:Zn-dependent peptidase ImmA (M78 family)